MFVEALRKANEVGEPWEYTDSELGGWLVFGDGQHPRTAQQRIASIAKGP